MKYDLTKCNNLHWCISDAKGDKEGFIKLKKIEDNSIEVCLFNDAPFGVDALNDKIVRSMHGSTKIDFFYNVFREEDFRIIPRDPYTYTDWQVGDNLKVIDQCQAGQVMALCGKIIAIKWIGKNAVEWLLKCWVDENCELLLTDYEKYIRDLEEKKPVCNFKEGDRVLVRSADNQEWELCIFEEVDIDGIYWANQCEWKQCIPFNEHTWRLLGTKDAYKEDKEC